MKISKGEMIKYNYFLVTQKYLKNYPIQSEIFYINDNFVVWGFRYILRKKYDNADHYDVSLILIWTNYMNMCGFWIWSNLLEVEKGKK